MGKTTAIITTLLPNQEWQGNSSTGFMNPTVTNYDAQQQQ